MTIAFTALTLDTIAKREGSIVLPVPGSARLSAAGTALDEAMGGAIGRAIAASRFHGKHGETMEFPVPGGMKADRVILVGLGTETERAAIRKAGGKAGAALGRLSDTGAAILLDAVEGPEMAVEFALGIALRRYAFHTYKSRVDPKSELGDGVIEVMVGDVAAAESGFEAAHALVEGVFMTRDLVSEPANVLYPVSYAERLSALASHGLEVEVLDEAALEKLGMRTLLAVGLGSECESRVVIMKWMGAEDKSAKPFCVIGKGVTFDTGGISIKPAAGMEEMTMDMGGSAVVSGLMKTLAMRKAKANVIGVVGLVENMPDGKATRPGDIVEAMSGTTVEIINTDAEGRLVLADILHYAQREFSPAATVNLATLTGAIIIALGNSKAGLFSNSDELSADLLAAAESEGEGLWRMPLDKEYDDLIKSSLADIKNTGGRGAGSITAAQFLQRFVDDSPWAHLDIAGVTLGKEAKALHPKGATGWGVATLDRYIRNKFES